MVYHSTSFAFLVDAQAVGRGDDIGVTMVARNDSLSSFECLELEIRQQARWLAEGHPGYAQRVIASGKFEGDELCVSKKMDGARRASKVAEDASGDLSQTLAAGGGTRYALTIPNTCADTVSMPGIVVTHSLVVKLLTSTCREETSVSIPLLVYQGVSMREGQPESAPLVRVLPQPLENRPQMADSTSHNTPQPQQPSPVQQQPTDFRILPIDDPMQHAPQKAILQQPTGFEGRAAAPPEVRLSGLEPSLERDAWCPGRLEFVSLLRMEGYLFKFSKQQTCSTWIVQPRFQARNYHQPSMEYRVCSLWPWNSALDAQEVHNLKLSSTCTFFAVGNTFVADSGDGHGQPPCRSPGRRNLGREIIPRKQYLEMRHLHDRRRVRIPRASWTEHGVSSTSRAAGVPLSMR